MRPLPRLSGLAYGGDYNPEQWPTSVWREDAKLMREAGVTLATVGVFSWAHLEPTPGEYVFGWLDEVVDLLHDAGIAVDLATATASPPPWLSAGYPESLPVDADGRQLWHGSRQAYCPSSPVYRDGALRLVTALAERYGRHPALALWHVGNEYGCHVPRCYCDVSAEAFRGWLRRRYADDLDALNAAWGTAFWSQRYSAWEQVVPPRATPAFGNPTQALDFHRFSSDELLDCYRAERDVLHAASPGVPVTTNLMAGMFWELDYWAWAAELDLVSTDHYLTAEDPLGHVDLAFAADLTRSLAGGRPWLLMEHSTGAVNWQDRNVAKAAGQLRRNSLTHVARGSEGAMFFQWRASVAGAEKFHSAMLPHAGTDTRLWREVTDLGAELAALAEVAGSTVERPAVALLLDWSSIWSARLPTHPSVDMDEVAELKAWHAAFWRAGVNVDFVRPGADLSTYRLVCVPSLYLVDDAGADAVRRYVNGGGHLVVGPFSGIVDGDDHVRTGGYPGALRDVLGVSVEEFLPLPAAGRAALDDGTVGLAWSEHVRLTGAEALAHYTGEADGYPDRPLAGEPAITRHTAGAGAAWYLSTRLDPQALDRWLARIADGAGIARRPEAVPSGVEMVRRAHPDGPSYLFVVNHSTEEAVVPAAGTELLTGVTTSEGLRVPARGAAVLREAAGAPRERAAGQEGAP